jgi:predicted metalloendopeptidase
LLAALGLRADIDPRDFDPAVRPQDNFYLYANGAWLKSHPIPSDRTSWGNFAELAERNLQNLHAVCEELARPGAAHGEIERKVGDFYASGMDAAAAEAAGAKALRPELNRIAALRTPSDVMTELGRLKAMGAGTGFIFEADPDKKDSATELANFGQGGLGLPDRDYYFRDDAQARTLRSQYVEHIARMMVLLGDDGETAQIEATTIMQLETALAHPALGKVALRDPYKTYHKMSREEFVGQVAPGADWPAFLAATGAPAFGQLNCAEPEFFRAFARLLAETPVASWRAYLRWGLINAAAPYLSDAFVREDFDFYGAKLTGQQEMRPRWKRVVTTEDQTIGEALGQMYVARYFPPESKRRVIALVGNLRASLKDRISHLDWMDEETRQRALAKLAAFSMKLGYPDHWKDYSSVVIDRTSYVGNVMAANAFEVARNLRKIGGPVDKSEWLMTPPTVNAYYQSSSNEVVFPAGILQPPFFDAQADDAVNYGAIGMVIGHEITHGFDDQGRRYDPQGNLKDWWTPGSAERFGVRAEKIVRQFSGYTIAGGLHLNGQLTEGENIADLGGLKISFAAMERALEGQSRAPIGGFTPEQRFFLSYATLWRTNYRPEALRLLVLTNPHSPAEFRVNGPLSDLDEFARAFGVPPGAPMRRSEAERPAIW